MTQLRALRGPALAVRGAPPPGGCAKAQKRRRAGPALSVRGAPPPGGCAEAQKRRRAGPALALGLAALWAGCGRQDAAVELASTITATVADAGASNPTAALAPDGSAAYVAWVGTVGEQSDVFLSRSDARGGFTGSIRVNDRPGDAAPHAQAPAQVAAGPGGVVYVVWQNNTPVAGRRFPASDLRFARSTDGGRTFEPAIYVNDDAGGALASHTFHDLAVAPDGTIYVSWIDGREQAAADHGASDTGHHGNAGGGVAHAGHHGSTSSSGGDTAGPRIRVARSTDGGRSFQPGKVVADNACPCCRTSLAVGPRGEVYVAWRTVYEGGARDVVVARSTDGGATFSAPVRVHRDDWVIEACPHAGPALAVDRAGRVHVAWFTGAEGRAGAYYATSDSAGSFGVPTPLTPPGPTPTTQVRLAADEQGGVWIAWENPEGDAATLRLARAAGERRPPALTLDSLAGTLPALASRNGRVALAWLDGESVRVLTGTHAAR